MHMGLPTWIWVQDFGLADFSPPSQLYGCKLQAKDASSAHNPVAMTRLYGQANTIWYVPELTSSEANAELGPWLGLKNYTKLITEYYVSVKISTASALKTNVVLFFGVILCRFKTLLYIFLSFKVTMRNPVSQHGQATVVECACCSSLRSCKGKCQLVFLNVKQHDTVVQQSSLWFSPEEFFRR